MGLLNVSQSAAMKPDKSKTYYLGNPEKVWAWGESYYCREWFGDPIWYQVEGCFDPDCCGDVMWDEDSKTEEEFEEYLNSFPDEKMDSL